MSSRRAKLCYQKLFFSFVLLTSSFFWLSGEKILLSGQRGVLLLEFENAHTMIMDVNFDDLTLLMAMVFLVGNPSINGRKDQHWTRPVLRSSPEYAGLLGSDCQG